MADTASDQLQTLFGKLDTQITNGQPKRALKTIDEILKAAPGDQDAVLSKVALLIDLGNVTDAIAVIDAHPALKTSLAFERAYCLYRQGQLKEALAALDTVPAERAVARLQLEAQLQYRLGNPKEAIALYSRLFQEDNASADSKEVQTNVLAAYVAGGRSSDLPSVMEAMRVKPTDSFEIAFNTACGFIDRSLLDEADQQLALARRVGEESLYDDELDEEEVEVEMAPVVAQVAYVAQQRGHFEEAIENYASVLDVVPEEDQATASVAAINACAAAAFSLKFDRKNAVEKLKRLEVFVERSLGVLKPKIGVEQRLGASHCKALLVAYASAAIAAGKSDVAKEAIKGLEKQYPGLETLPLLHATLLAKEGKAKEAQNVLTTAGTPTALLMKVQLAASTGDNALALEILHSLPAPLATAPAVACTKAALLEKLEKPEEAAQALESLAATAASAPSAAAWVARRLASLRLKAGYLDGATQKLKQLVELTPDVLNDPQLVVMYARLAAYTNTATATSLVEQLPAVDTLTAAEIDALEAAGVGTVGSRSRAAAKAAADKDDDEEDGGDGGAAERKNKKKRKRKPRLPKNFDPENPGKMPDPERWLPKWQRADAKKARKKRKDKADVIKGSQGAGKVDASLDISTKAAAVDVEMADAKKGGAGTSGGGGKGKGKKKGRR